MMEMEGPGGSDVASRLRCWVPPAEGTPLRPRVLCEAEGAARSAAAASGGSACARWLNAEGAVGDAQPRSRKADCSSARTFLCVWS